MDSSQGIEFNGLNLKEKTQWTEEVLRKFKYQWFKRKGKGILRRYIEKVTGYSRVPGLKIACNWYIVGIKTKERRGRFTTRFDVGNPDLLILTRGNHYD
jgi:hypothetical protein